MRFKQRSIVIGILLFGYQLTAQNDRTFIEKQLIGIENVRNNNAVSVADYNLDGHPDLFIVATDKTVEGLTYTYSRLFRNNNDATFTDVTEEANLEMSYDYDGHGLSTLPYDFEGELRHGASWGDFDNDGDPDLFLTNFMVNKLYENNGDGSFTDVTAIAGLDDNQECYSTSAAWIDYDNDSDLDLFVSSWALCEDNRLYVNNGDGTFTENSQAIAVEGDANTWMILPVDVNSDQWVDLFMVNDFRNNVLLINDQGVFTDQTTDYGFIEANPRNHMGADYQDVNNDGQLDIYISDINRNGLWIREGDQFSDFAEILGVHETEWSWQTRLVDMDLDGDRDILVANGYIGYFGNYYLRNDFNGTLSFTNESANSGFARVSNSMCLEVFDYDHDGDLDVLVTELEGAPFFLENQTIGMDSMNTPNWIKIDLVGTVSNRSAIGTTVKVISDDDSEQVTYYTGVGFMTQSLQPVLFGLGEQSAIRRIEITWPSGITENFENLPVNSTIRITETEGYEILNFQSNKVPGCTDPNSCSYQPMATIDDGSCTYLEPGRIEGNSTVGAFNIETYQFPIAEGNGAHWTISGGRIIDGQGTSELKVQWLPAATGKLEVYEVGECHSDLAELQVQYAGNASNRQFSIARMWNELLLQAIRNDDAMPTIHARNLFHSSALMHDIFVLYTGKGKPYLAYENFEEIQALLDSTDPEAFEVALSYAMYRLLNSRFATSAGKERIQRMIEDFMLLQSLDPGYYHQNYSAGNPADIGNYLANQMIQYGFSDGSREQFGYRNNHYQPVNQPLNPQIPGNASLTDPNRWQPLQLNQYIDENGNVVGPYTPDFLSPEWGNVKPFALNGSDLTVYGDFSVFYDPGNPPLISHQGFTSTTNDHYKWGFSLVSIWGSHLDPNDGVIWDVSPAGMGNLTTGEFPGSWEMYPDFYNFFEGGNPGNGHAINPSTGKFYEPQLVARGDYTRVLAEYWADGPDSETPPGHWFTILNYVSDQPGLERKIGGDGETLDRLEWDIRSYFMLGGALHDAAIAAWSIKGWYDYIRPISAIRYMAQQGQSTDEELPSFNEHGIQLVDGFIEVVTAGDELAGPGGENVGKIKLYTWRGHDLPESSTGVARAGWVLAENWLPYQKKSRITPPSAGFVSGHSTFSRAAAEVLTLLTGSAYFPGGLGEFTARKNEFLKIENGPESEVKLQWATYRDASDQCGLSRIWGGVNSPADDLRGRLIGIEVGQATFIEAMEYFDNVVTSSNKIAPESNVFPNPVNRNQLVRLSYTDEITSIRLFDIKGGEIPVAITSMHDSMVNIDISNVRTAGIYILSINHQSIRLIVK